MKKTFQDCHRLFKMKHQVRGIGMVQRLGAGILASGIAALVLKLVGGQPAKVLTAQALEWQNMPLFDSMALPDPATETIMNQYLQGLSAQGAVARHQGIWIQSDISVLAKHKERVPLPAASLTKIATTLAALNKWEPDHQFETLVSTTGPINKGVLQGDLVITGGGDPFFVWEEAIALGNSLNQLGIRQVKGNVVIEGDFYMNYQENPALAGQELRQGLNSKLWTARGFVYRHAIMPKGTPKPQVAIAGGVKVSTLPIPKKILLIRHRSLSLTHILREMNIHSNNNMSEMLTKSLGGSEQRNRLAAKSANLSLDELQLVNGSGLGVENMISPHAACTMLMAVHHFLQPYKLSVMDVFPVSGRDKNGTMYGRHIPLGTAIKTGTLNTVSALAGVIPTRDRGLVWFAIINRGGDVNGFRKQQDIFLQRLVEQWGIQPVNATTPPIQNLLGESKRNEKIFGVRAQLKKG
jgi:D-alanyl-D-alanine carboxypeptidase/D-alanyl-D-alanine-endopeptidase (penicillin-binding protein 4)